MLPYLEKKVFADVIKNLEMERESWIIQRPLNELTCPSGEDLTHTEKVMWRQSRHRFEEAGLKDWSDMATRQVMRLTATARWKKARNRFLLKASGVSTFLVTPWFCPRENDIELVASRTVKINLYCFKPPSSW